MIFFRRHSWWVLFAFCIADCDALDIAIFVPEPGLCSVSFEAVVSTETPTRIPVDQLVMTQLDTPIPFWLFESGTANDIFESGESLVFLPTQTRTANLGFVTGEPPVRLRTKDPPVAVQGEFRTLALPVEESPAVSGFEMWEKFEEDRIRIGFPTKDFHESERFFWKKLSPLDPEGWTLPPAPRPFRGTGSIVFSACGATTLPDRPTELSEHVLEVTHSQAKVLSWNGPYPVEMVVKDVDFGEQTALELKVPARATASGEFIADLVYIDQVEYRMPVREAISAIDAPLHIFNIGGENRGGLSLETADAEMRIFSESGVCYRLAQAGRYEIPRDEAERFVLAAENFMPPPGDTRPWREITGWKEVDGSGDYLIVVPEALRKGTGPLAEHYRREGKNPVTLITEEIYDEFGGGEATPHAIAEAIRRWAGGRANDDLGYVLLVGDASTEPVGKGRNLLPAWTHQIRSSICASDNPYACLSDDDALPDLAVGRIPAATLDELRIYVEKRLASEGSGDAVEALWVVDHESENQSMVDEIIGGLADPTIEHRRIFAPAAGGNSDSVERLLTALRGGPDWVFYHGHGARHVWQLGTADYVDQSTLFTSERLRNEVVGMGDGNSARFVFASTCDNAPFDHPEDDSLGERFVLLPRGGADSFVGASWRIQNDPNVIDAWARAASESATVGEALVKAKALFGKRRRMVETLNLLGDPALPVR